MKLFDAEHTRRVMLLLHEEGVEMTAEQVNALRRAAYAAIRREMCKRGFKVPDDDESLFWMIREARGWGE